MVPAAPPQRVAWFSPMPPSASGIAAYSAELVPALRARGLAIDVFAEPPDCRWPGAIHAREFVWMQRRRPYDLVVYQLGNARCHDFMWGHLFRYPGLVMLHDAQIHQARARQLLQHWIPRTADYEAEFVANHPDAPPDLAQLFAAGHGGALYTHWPFVRLVLQSARLAAVHSPGLAARLSAAHGVDVDVVPMGVPDPLVPPPAIDAAVLRARYGVPADAFLLGAVGGLTPEKRLPQVLTAMQALGALPIHLLAVGAPAGHYDLLADAAARGLADRVHVTGFVPDAELGAHLAALDACACLRWPSNGETSASWWRAMAAGRATIVTDLPHQAEIPVRDATTWLPVGGAATPVAAAVRILDEHRGLVTALNILATDPVARHGLGTAARSYWAAHHTLEAMAEAYLPVMARAATRPAPRVTRPAHLDETGDERVRELLAPFGLPLPASVAGDRA